jgi:hypothetical protein
MLMRRTLILSIAIAAAAIPAAADAQVPKGLPAAVDTAVSYGGTAAELACPTWTTTTDTIGRREERCEVAPTPGVAYTCVRGSELGRPRTAWGGCSATAGTATAACGSSGTFDEYGSDNSRTCAAALGETELVAIRCDHDGFRRGAVGNSDDSCTSGPVTVEEQSNDSLYPESHASSFTAQAGDAQVRCDDTDGDELYEAEDCRVGD